MLAQEFTDLVGHALLRLHVGHGYRLLECQYIGATVALDNDAIKSNQAGSIVTARIEAAPQ